MFGLFFIGHEGDKERIVMLTFSEILSWNKIISATFLMSFFFFTC